jgi:C1A family cysteine protease
MQSSARKTVHLDTAPLVGADGRAATVDWRTKGAVTEVKDQGGCGVGSQLSNSRHARSASCSRPCCSLARALTRISCLQSCWAFATTGSVEGAFAIATGSLRSLSEQQLVDCSRSFNNSGCQGGLMDPAFEYIIANGGLDSEAEYSYYGMNTPCWRAGEKRHVATIDAYNDVPRNSSSQMAAAVLKQPVAVAICAKGSFMSYKSGIFDDEKACDCEVNHGVLIVGYTDQAWIVKNSWGDSWGEQGYVRMARNATGPGGICNILSEASYPTLQKEPPPPVPPPTPTPQPPMPGTECGCSVSAAQMCAMIGQYSCCCKGDDVTCAAKDQCCPDSRGCQ